MILVLADLYLIFKAIGLEEITKIKKTLVLKTKQGGVPTLRDWGEEQTKEKWEGKTSEEWEKSREWL